MSSRSIDRHRTFIKSGDQHRREPQQRTSISNTSINRSSHNQAAQQYYNNNKNAQDYYIDDGYIVRKGDVLNGSDGRVEHNIDDDEDDDINISQRLNGMRSRSGQQLNRNSSNINTNNNDNGATDKNLEIANLPVCNRFGFIVDEDAENGGVANMRNFLDDDMGDDKQSREQALATMLKREKKWLSMIDNWDSWILSKRFERLKKRCRKGIPSAVRGKAWFYLSAGHIAMEKYPRFYEKLEREPGDEQVCDEIRKDIHRQFPNHELFREANGPGQQSLFNVLKCFSIARKEISYCQGLAPVASILLMNMPPSHAFWSLIAIADQYVPGYYLAGFQAVQLHGRMLYGLLKKYAPVAHRILKKGDIDPVLYMFEWFMCLFVRNLPWATVLRIWDMFLCEGIVVVFKAAIIIIETTITSDHKKLDQHDILQLLKNVPEKELHESIFIPKVIKLNLTDKHLKREHRRQLRKKAKGK